MNQEQLKKLMFVIPETKEQERGSCRGVLQYAPTGLKFLGDKIMTYNSQKHHRRSIPLKGYDYS
ncbi:hypothetical protein [Umezakia ovalisporum]|uniref:hypothetical protein n=1 Tax=Umezakia ovalisporum TaxID=75695 RepID=UPI0039C62E03